MPPFILNTIVIIFFSPSLDTHILHCSHPNWLLQTLGTYNYSYIAEHIKQSEVEEFNCDAGPFGNTLF